MHLHLLLLLAGLALGPARDYLGEINAILDQYQAASAQPLLDDWKVHGGEQDPEYWIAASNVWHEVARRTVVENSTPKPGLYKLGKKRANGLTLTLRDAKTGKPAGAMRFVDTFDPADQQRAYAALEEGARRFPERLDIAVGLAYLHREAKDLAGEVAALRAMVAQVRALQRAPLWEKQPLGGTTEEFGLSMLNQYAVEHYQGAEGEAGKNIGELTVELFPDKPQGYNLIGHYYAERDDYQTDKTWLTKALEHAPEDSLMLANLADCEERLGKHAEAQAIYRRIVKLDNDPKQVTRAQRALKQANSSIHTLPAISPATSRERLRARETNAPLP